jgi:hypothetical protein
MLAEKFFLVLETLISHASDDKPHIVISTAPHIPIGLPHRRHVSPKQLTALGSPPVHAPAGFCLRKRRH